MDRLPLLIMVICAKVTIVCAGVKLPIRAGNASIKNSIKEVDINNLPAKPTYQDSIPIGRYKYYKIDEANNLRYLNTSLNENSVKQEKASKSDWDEYAKTYTNLQNTFQLNPFDNVQNYIDTGKDFIELKLLTQDFFPNTAKVCLRQLMFNMQLLVQLLTKPIAEKADVQILSFVTNNIDVLINKYVATRGTVMSIAGASLPNVSIKVFDNKGAEITNAKCYFISFKTCRDIACRTCIPGLDPCADINVNAITTKPDIIFDCINPAKIRVDYGHYHFFVISNNKIRYYEQMHIDENTLSSEENTQIKIKLP